jgi:hypothetical protein
MNDNDIKQKIVKIFCEHFIEELCERQDDEKQRLFAINIYDTISKYLKTLKPIESVVDLSVIFNKPLYLNFINIINPEKQFSALYSHTHSTILINSYPHLTDEFNKKHFLNIYLKMETPIIHELIHFIDSINYGDKISNNKKINGPAEFNAYYQSFTLKFDKKLTYIISNKNNDKMDQFNTEIGNTSNEFINKFWNEHKELYKQVENSKIYKAKWNKRLYQLYYELKQKLEKYLIIINMKIKKDQVVTEKITTIEELLK